MLLNSGLAAEKRVHASMPEPCGGAMKSLYWAEHEEESWGNGTGCDGWQLYPHSSSSGWPWSWSITNRFWLWLEDAAPQR